MSDILELVIPVKLETPNLSRGRHWRAWQRETKRWEAALRYLAGNRFAAWTLVEGTQSVFDEQRQTYAIVEVRMRERRRVTVVRQVASGREFIRDDDNLHFCLKPVNDAMKRLGLIYQDSRKWLEQPPIAQQIAPDGIARTIVRIERLPLKKETAA